MWNVLCRWLFESFPRGGPNRRPFNRQLFGTGYLNNPSRCRPGYANSVPVRVSVVARCKPQFAQFPYELHVYGTISTETKRGSCPPNKEIINEVVEVEANRDNIDVTLAKGEGLCSLEVFSPFDEQARILIDVRAQIDAHFVEIYGPGNAIDYRTATWEGNGKVNAGATYEVTRLTNAAHRVDEAILLALGGLIGALIALAIQSLFNSSPVPHPTVQASDSKNHGKRRRPILRPARYRIRPGRGHRADRS
jgi:hypothetical protein